MPRKSPTPHQYEALTAIDSTLLDNDRANVVMACGTGKTLVELWATERQLATVQGPHRVVVLVPTLQLLQQVYQEWQENNRWGSNMRTICVCSDSKIGKDDDEIAIEDLGFPTSTDPEIVRQFLLAGEQLPGKVSVVFSTYQSASVIAEATAVEGGPAIAFHAGVFDEAHKTVGEDSTMFSQALDDKNIRVDKRIFFTATPRVINSNRRRNAEGDIIVATMDDETVYGPRAHTLGFAEAARRGIIVPYKVIVSVINGDLTAQKINSSEVVVDTADGQIGVRGSTMAALVAMDRAMEERGLKKAITFHSTVAAAEEFAGITTEATQEGAPAVPRFAISGRQRAADRAATMAAFRNSDRAVISNAKCLTEGVDVPTVDLVSFIDPRKSKVDIVQATGRSMRKAGPDKKFGYVFVPLHIDMKQGETIDVALSRSGFGQLTSILLALAESDEELLDVLMASAIQIGEGGKFESAILNDIIEFDLSGLDAGNDIARQQIEMSIEVKLIEELVDNFYFMLGRVKSFKNEYGHFDFHSSLGEDHEITVWARNQRSHKNRNNPNILTQKQKLLDEIGFPWRLSSQQVSEQENLQFIKKYFESNGSLDGISSVNKPAIAFLQRQRKKRQMLGEAYPQDLARELTAMGFSWDPSEENLRTAEAFFKENGHLRPPYKGPIYTYLRSQRQMYGKRPEGYPKERKERLDRIGMVWHTFDDANESRLQQAEEFFKKNGHINVPYGEPLNAWLVCQRVDLKKLGNDYPKGRKNRLDALGFSWDRSVDRANYRMNEARSFFEANGHLSPPKNTALYKWLIDQRAKLKYSTESYPKDLKEELDRLGMIWDTAAHSLEKSMKEVEDYFKSHGNLYVPSKHPIGGFLRSQRQVYERKKDAYPAELKARFEAMGFYVDGSGMTAKQFRKQQITARQNQRQAA